MKIGFRHGLVQHYTVASVQQFLLISGNTVSLRALNKPVIYTISHLSSNYLFVENQDVNSAWTIDSSVDQWIGVDVDLVTGARTFISTGIEPTFGTTQPVTPVVGQYWFNTATMTMMKWSGSRFVNCVTLFLAKISSNNAYGMSTGGSFNGSSVGDWTTIDAGFIVFDEVDAPVKRYDGTFLTTQSPLSSTLHKSSYVKVGSTGFTAPVEQNLSAYTLVKLNSNGRISTAGYLDVGASLCGIVENDLTTGEVGRVMVEGYFENDDWDWSAPNLPLYVDEFGTITESIPPTATKIGYTINSKSMVLIKDVMTAGTAGASGSKGEPGAVGQKGEPGSGGSGSLPAATNHSQILRMNTIDSVGNPITPEPEFFDIVQATNLIMNQPDHDYVFGEAVQTDLFELSYSDRYSHGTSGVYPEVLADIAPESFIPSSETAGQFASTITSTVIVSLAPLQSMTDVWIQSTFGGYSGNQPVGIVFSLIKDPDTGVEQTLSLVRNVTPYGPSGYQLALVYNFGQADETVVVNYHTPGDLVDDLDWANRYCRLSVFKQGNIVTLMTTSMSTDPELLYASSYRLENIDLTAYPIAAPFVDVPTAVGIMSKNPGINVTHYQFGDLTSYYTNAMNSTGAKLKLTLNFDHLNFLPVVDENFVNLRSEPNVTYVDKSSMMVESRIIAPTIIASPRMAVENGTLNPSETVTLYPKFMFGYNYEPSRLIIQLTEFDNDPVSPSFGGYRQSSKVYYSFVESDYNDRKVMVHNPSADVVDYKITLTYIPYEEYFS